MKSKTRTHYLPRLPKEFYQGDAVIHWTLTVFDRGTGWLNETFHQRFRELMLHAGARERLFCPTYCLMTDHLHLCWMGLHFDSDQRNGMAFLRTYLEPLLSPHKFQPQAHDRVLREQERMRNAFAELCYYILDNPMRGGLVDHPAHWPYSGAIVPGFPKLHPLEQDYWPRYWNLYAKARHDDAGNRALPPRSAG